MILLFVAFGMLIAAGLPLLLAVAASQSALPACTCSPRSHPVGVVDEHLDDDRLAVGIDYSLFIVSRYREERVDGKDALAAIETTLSTAGKAVFLSALTVVLSLAAIYSCPSWSSAPWPSA